MTPGHISVSGVQVFPRCAIDSSVQVFQVYRFFRCAIQTVPDAPCITSPRLPVMSHALFQNNAVISYGVNAKWYFTKLNTFRKKR